MTEVEDEKMAGISEILLNQRIRNRIIEVIEVYISLEAQRLLGSAEVINMWEDWVDDTLLESFVEPVFTKQEQLAIVAFHNNWNKVCESTPYIMPEIDKLKDSRMWNELIKNAKETFDILMIRGYLSEEREII